MKQQFLRITDISSDFLLAHDPVEVEQHSLLNINLNRVILNLLNSMGDFFSKETKAIGLRKPSLKQFLNQEENKSIFSCGIWMSILEYNFRETLHPDRPVQPKATVKRKKTLRHETPKKQLRRRLRKLNTTLQQRIALSYISLMKKVQKEVKMILEKVFFDIVAQAVFYSLFYAFPKSRVHFDYDFRYFLFSLMSKFFVGIVVSPVSRFSKHWTFVDDWYLDLGAGNVLAKKIYHKKNGQRSPEFLTSGNYF